MQILHGHTGLPAAARGAVAALGNFDGVHAGHRAVIAQAGALARKLDAKLAVALFEPHPRRFFQPDGPPFRLMSAQRRNQILEELGVAQLHVLDFDAALAAMSPAQFVEQVLADGLGLRGVVTGADFCFGKGRAGDAAALARLGAACGIEVESARLRAEAGEKISSSRIRALLREGDVQAAAGLLGGPFSVAGPVIRGDQRGRTIGFATANIEMGNYTRPAYGVYAVTACLPGESRERPGVANLGRRPTVDGTREVLEVHLFDYQGDLYGLELDIAFRTHLRAEQKFDGLAALKAQIAEDARAARTVLGLATGPA